MEADMQRYELLKQEQESILKIKEQEINSKYMRKDEFEISWNRF